MKNLFVLLILSVFVITGCNQTLDKEIPLTKEIPSIIDTTVNIDKFLEDSFYCEQNSDCVPESLCRPTNCVNKYYLEKNPIPIEECFMGDYCGICISCKKCINNQCEREVDAMGCC